MRIQNSEFKIRGGWAGDWTLAPRPRRVGCLKPQTSDSSRESWGWGFAVPVSVSVPGFRRQRQRSGTAAGNGDRRPSSGAVAVIGGWDCPGLRPLITDAAICPGHRLLSLSRPLPPAGSPSHSGTAWRCQAPPQMLRSRAPIRFRRCLAPARGHGKIPLTSTHPSPDRAPRGCHP